MKNMNHELEEIAKIIKDRVYRPRAKSKVSIFLCGADKNDSSTARYQAAKLFEGHPKYEILYPEDLFDDLLAGQGKYSLLEMENTLANSVEVILILPESPGSYAELGAFANNQNLAKKIICLSQEKFKLKKSFLNYGPYRLIKKSKTGKVFHINYDHLKNGFAKQKIYRNITDRITKIRKEHPVPKDVANILETENFVLPCIYLMNQVSNFQLYLLMKYATNYKDILCEIAVKSSLTRLVEQRLITRVPEGYSMTPAGSAHVRNNFKDKDLDKARLEIMNCENRRNAKIRYDRIFPPHP